MNKCSVNLYFICKTCDVSVQSGETLEIATVNNMKKVHRPTQEDRSKVKEMPAQPYLYIAQTNQTRSQSNTNSKVMNNAETDLERLILTKLQNIEDRIENTITQKLVENYKGID